MIINIHYTRQYPNQKWYKYTSTNYVLYIYFNMVYLINTTGQSYLYQQFGRAKCIKMKKNNIMNYLTFIWRKRMNLVWVLQWKLMNGRGWSKSWKHIKEIQQEFDNKVRYSFHIPGIYIFFLQWTQCLRFSHQ